MRANPIVLVCLWSSLVACAAPPRPEISRDELFSRVVSSMPDYREFLTVDELEGALERLKNEFPDLVSLNRVGESGSGRPISELRIGDGSHHALLYGFPHPNEPIGSMMLHHLTRQLAENRELRDYFDFTWHVVICAEPDKARLNEGWFKGNLSLTKYARNFYRPPGHQQVDWTFPVTFKDYTFDRPIPEARALMRIIDSSPIDFLFSLHNSGFGGAYYYWSRDLPELYPTLYQFIASQHIPLHLGEPEVPFGEKWDDRAMFKMITFDAIYDYLEAYSPVPPKQVLTSGTSSYGYARRKHEVLAVVCELPYFYDPRIDDRSPSGMTRRQANLEGIEFRRKILRLLTENYSEAQPLLTTRSPFVDVIEERTKMGETDIETTERAVMNDEGYQREATVAEMWDAISASKFYTLLDLGQFVRLLEHEKAEAGDRLPGRLQEILDESLALFEDTAAEVEKEIDYTVVPIKKLASVQLFTALHAMDEVQEHP